jgi:hypothetical protein
VKTNKKLAMLRTELYVKGDFTQTSKKIRIMFLLVLEQFSIKYTKFGRNIVTMGWNGNIWSLQETEISFLFSISEKRYLKLFACGEFTHWRRDCLHAHFGKQQQFDVTPSIK